MRRRLCNRRLVITDQRLFPHDVLYRGHIPRFVFETFLRNVSWIERDDYLFRQRKFFREKKKRCALSWIINAPKLICDSMILRFTDLCYWWALDDWQETRLARWKKKKNRYYFSDCKAISISQSLTSHVLHSAVWTQSLLKSWFIELNFL